MKLNRQGLLLVATAAWFATSVTTQTSQAGEWLDSILGRRPPAYPVGTPVPVNGQVAAYSPGAYPSLGYVPPSYANLNAQQTVGYGSYAPNNNAPLFAPGFPQTVAGVLPTAAYDTQWSRTPVTYYRPVTAYDPRYGTTVTSLQPCTSYQYQAQRQPVIAPRPLLGDYGLQANRWPSITGPGYNPTGLASLPTYPTYQGIPSTGMPMVGQPAVLPPNMLAPTGGAGVTSGMPATTMPLSTMPYNPVAGSTPYAAQQAYYGAQVVNGQNYYAQPVVNPTYASSYSGYPSVGYPNVGWPAQTVGSGVVPTAAWMPTTTASPSTGCVNGVCPPVTGQVNPPNIPGAASVTPVGQPTYTTVPNSTANPNTVLNSASTYPATSFPGSGYTTPVPGYAIPSNSNSNVNPYAPQVMPNNQVMPPANSNPNLNPNLDPDASRRPSLGSSASLNSSRQSLDNPLKTQTVPMVAIDQEPISRSRETVPSLSTPNQTPNDAFALGNTSPSSDFTNNKPSTLGSSPVIPDTLPPKSNYGMQPLSAPEDLDSKPNWTPTLLEPEDRVAMEREAANNRTASARIKLQEEKDNTVTAIAFEPVKSNRNAIQLVSGTESKSAATSEQNVIRFRPVTKLK